MLFRLFKNPSSHLLCIQSFWNSPSPCPTRQTVRLWRGWPFCCIQFQSDQPSHCWEAVLGCYHAQCPISNPISDIILTLGFLFVWFLVWGILLCLVFINWEMELSIGCSLLLRTGWRNLSLGIPQVSERLEIRWLIHSLINNRENVSRFQSILSPAEPP